MSPIKGANRGNLAFGAAAQDCVGCEQAIFEDKGGGVMHTFKFTFVLIFSSVVVCFAETPEPSLRVMSFNIRLGVADDGENHWEKRKTLVKQAIDQYRPDLLGTQETYKFQAEFLKEELEEYQYFGRSRMNTPDEHCGIFYLRSRFIWLAGGHFWLSETPDVPESKSWDSSLPRMASWVLLHDRNSSEKPILLANTHFDHRGVEARKRAAEVILGRLRELRHIAGDPHVVLTGDFNCPEGSAPYQVLLASEELRDTYRAMHPARDEHEGTFNGWQGRKSGPRIDWVLAGPSLRTDEARIHDWSQQGRFPSDHFPVSAVLVPTAQ